MTAVYNKANYTFKFYATGLTRRDLLKYFLTAVSANYIFIQPAPGRNWTCEPLLLCQQYHAQGKYIVYFNTLWYHG
jgi:hypothetical protein